MELVSAMRIVLLGEGMVELSRSSADGCWQMGHGGDTLNTAIHLARLGRNVAYATALGGDPFSDDLRAAWAAEGIDPSLILTEPDRTAGLYAIRTDAHGERSFSYWRGESAARRMFALPGSAAMIEAAAQADLLCYSLISLAILPPEGREALFALARSVRARGGKVAFDGNCRPRLWSGTAAAQEARDAALACCDIGLPTLEDEAALSGLADADAVAAFWSSHGVGEVIVKLGAQGCRIPDGRIVPPPAQIDPIDTSGAGDAFNAGFLNAWLAGASTAAAALAGHRLAGWVVTQPGAIPAQAGAAPYSATENIDGR